MRHLPLRFAATALACALAACGSGVADVAPDSTASTEPAPTEPVVTATATFTIDLAADRKPISPHIYGANMHVAGVTNLTLMRSGGNRWSGYNWENNASHAGIDWQHFNDGYLGPQTPYGEAVRSRVAPAHAAGASAIVTVPMQDYVSRDRSGTSVTAEQVAGTVGGSTRWVRSYATKGSVLSLTPDATDDAVYQDEFVNWVETSFGAARAEGKETFYSLDNEPGLWNETLPRLHPADPSYAELKEKSVRYASMIRTRAPQAKIFGAVAYGWWEYETLQDAPDRSSYGNYLDFYLSAMKEAEGIHGTRLLDVLDLHWYPDIKVDGKALTQFTSPTLTDAQAEAIMQAPRSFWDATFRENSWIGQWYHPIRLLPRMKEKIAARYPGTRLAITEYNFGGNDHIAGGIAHADTLGIFGREGLFAAAWWDLSSHPDNYIAGAFNLYLNYDGNGAKVGDLSLPASSDNAARTSVYAMASSSDAAVLHVVAINKDSVATRATLAMGANAAYSGADIYQIRQGSPVPQFVEHVTCTNGASYVLPARSVTLLVQR